MSPTILRIIGSFFSREEDRMRIHVMCQNGEAKFWLSPKIELLKIMNYLNLKLMKLKI